MCPTPTPSPSPGPREGSSREPEEGEPPEDIRNKHRVYVSIFVNVVPWTRPPQHSDIQPMIKFQTKSELNQFQREASRPTVTHPL